MLEYRVGDKVRIKSKKWYDSLKNRDGIIDGEIVAFGFNTYMAKLCGKIGIITDVVNTNYCGKRIKKYFLDIDDGWWKWSEGMFDLNKNMLEIE
jgi:hypothetical protein